MNALRISGPGADTIAIAGNDSGNCRYPSPSLSATPFFTPSPSPSPGSQDCDVAKTVTGRSKNEFRMNAGGPALGITNFGAENVNYIVENKGRKARTSVPVSVPRSSHVGDLFQTEKYTLDSTLTYKVPVPNTGAYTVSTYHAETYFSAAGKRSFNIVINGVTMRKNLDVFVAAGGKNKALLVNFFDISPVDGFITISFTKVIQNPFVNGIQIYGYGAGNIAIGGLEDGSCKSQSPKISPLPSPSFTVPDPDECDVAVINTGRSKDTFKMNIGGFAVSDGWGAENTNYLVGDKGSITERIIPQVTGALGPGDNVAVFNWGKFTSAGALTYKIPAPSDSSYTVTTYHAEKDFSSVGKRVFDIVINGIVVKKDLDVFAAAGGNFTALIQEFPNTASVDGFITVSFTKKVGNPFINAIKLSGVGADTIATAGLKAGYCRVDSPRLFLTSPSPSTSVIPSSARCLTAKTKTGRSKDAFSMNVGGPATGTFGADNMNYIAGSIGFSKSRFGRFVYSQFSSARVAKPDFLTYEIPVPSGLYTVKTYFTELDYTAGQNSFNIRIHGALMRRHLDVAKEAGGENKELILSFHNIPAVNGVIAISFTKSYTTPKTDPFVNAIKTSGPGADSIAIAGPENGLCQGKPPRTFIVE